LNRVPDGDRKIHNKMELPRSLYQFDARVFENQTLEMFKWVGASALVCTNWLAVLLSLLMFVRKNERIIMASEHVERKN